MRMRHAASCLPARARGPGSRIRREAHRQPRKARQLEVQCHDTKCISEIGSHVILTLHRIAHGHVQLRPFLPLRTRRHSPTCAGPGSTSGIALARRWGRRRTPTRPRRRLLLGKQELRQQQTGQREANHACRARQASLENVRATWKCPPTATVQDPSLGRLPTASELVQQLVPLLEQTGSAQVPHT